MKPSILPLLTGVLVLAGCAHNYVMKLNNGTTLTTASKPKLEHGNYVFKDSLGRTNYVPQGRVVEVAPASMATEENKFQAAPTPEPKNHWWQFWR